MGNKLTNNLPGHLDEFLMDVAQGVYGTSTLNYKTIHSFAKEADENDIHLLGILYYDIVDNEEDESKIKELETFINGVINPKA